MLPIIFNIKNKQAIIITATTLLVACGSSSSGTDSNDNNPNASNSKVRAIASLDDYSQFEVTVKTTASSCEPEYIGEAAEYDMRINNELGNIKIATGPRAGPDEFLLEGTRFGSSNLVLNGKIDTYAHRVDFDEIEVFFHGVDENGTFTHLSANFDWSFGSANTPCTGSSSIQGVKFDALDHFDNSPVIPANGVAQWTLGSDNFNGDTFTFWGQVFKGHQLLQVSSALVDQGQNKSTSVTLSIAKYTGPGTYPISADEYNSVFVLQFDNGNFNNCVASPQNNNTSGTITVQDQGDEILVQYSSAMNCYSDSSLETFTNMENSTGSFTVDEDS